MSTQYAGSSVRPSHRSRLAPIAMLAGLAGIMVACDAGKSSAPLSSKQANSRPSYSTYNAGTLTLGLTIGAGVSRFNPSGNYKIWRNVTGGSGPYTSYWAANRCFDGGCTGMQPLAVTTDDTLLFYAEPDLIKVNIALVVGDASGNTWAGDYTRVFLGPITVSPPPSAPCDNGDHSTWGYPFYSLTPPDTATQTGFFRENACTGAKIWEPKP